MNIKNEHGVTLTSLIIYVISMLLTITIITIVTGYFKKNVDMDVENYTFSGEFTKFENYFSEEVNRDNNKILDVVNGESNSQSYVVFSSGNQYTFIPQNKAIYQNNVKITSGVENCVFNQKIVNGHNAISVSITIKGNKESMSQSRNTTYVLKNW